MEKSAFCLSWVRRIPVIKLLNLKYFCLEVDSVASLLRVKHIVNPIVIALTLTEFQRFGTEALRKFDLQTKSLKSLPHLASIIISFGAG